MEVPLCVVYFDNFPFIFGCSGSVDGLEVPVELLEFCVVCNFAADDLIFIEWPSCRLGMVDLRKFLDLLLIQSLF
jgi:hypothetical protein